MQIISKVLNGTAPFELSLLDVAKLFAANKTLTPDEEAIRLGIKRLLTARDTGLLTVRQDVRMMQTNTYEYESPWEEDRRSMNFVDPSHRRTPLQKHQGINASGSFDPKHDLPRNAQGFRWVMKSEPGEIFISARDMRNYLDLSNKYTPDAPRSVLLEDWIALHCGEAEGNHTAVSEQTTALQSLPQQHMRRADLEKNYEFFTKSTGKPLSFDNSLGKFNATLPKDATRNDYSRRDIEAFLANYKGGSWGIRPKEMRHSEQTLVAGLRNKK